MAYGTIAGVQALVPTLGTMSGSTVPTSTQATAWLVEGSARIDRTLAGAGYAVPVAADAGLYPELDALANLYAAAYCVRARGMDTGSGETESRDVIWLQEFSDRLTELAGTDLVAFGLLLATVAGARRRTRIRSTQLRKIDGYSAARETDIALYDYPSE